MTSQSRVLTNAFLQFLSQLRKDAMLLLVCIAPVLCGLFFRLGIPFAQTFMIKYLDRADILPNYYLLMDLLLISITPLLYCYASAYVILGEIDDGISRYLAVTPLGKKGYLLSRLGIPTLLAIIITIVLTWICKLTNLGLTLILLLSLLSGLMGIIEALLVVSISSNKVEGMAISKLSGLFFLGLPAPFFITGKIQYLLFIFPSFWIAKYAIDSRLLFSIAGLISALLWILLLYQRFKKKII